MESDTVCQDEAWSMSITELQTDGPFHEENISSENFSCVLAVGLHNSGARIHQRQRSRNSGSVSCYEAEILQLQTTSSMSLPLPWNDEFSLRV